MNNITLDNAFKRVCATGLDNAAADDVKTIAVSLWHHNELPDTSILKSSDEIKTGGFILDTLCRFNCVPYDLKYEILALAESMRNSLPKQDDVMDTPAPPPIDDLAIGWGLRNDLGKFMSVILPFQSRHAFGCASFA
ncbi:hypothetical protein SJI19_21920 [Acerihabitans sp. TG2]|uniref:hypothetical protein n=1 Tax=Acerihabitans sp. TG2 TaxID=3096008 RepID=UPI002B222F1E|nr:hypothetical protein [Acerihabitans sp. TG2]MEA9393162.1 hypothetical protein [Acerihabitans sp. TG2]